MGNRLHAEWIEYMKAFRLYLKERPQCSVAYEEDIEAAKKRAIEEGYYELFVDDKSTTREKGELK